MNGIPARLDLNYLDGRRVVQVSVGEFQTQLHIEGDVEIAIEGDVTVGGDRMPIGVEAGKRLVSLVGSTISGVEVEDARTLRIRFDRAGTVLLHDSNAAGESFVVTSPHDRLVV